MPPTAAPSTTADDHRLAAELARVTGRLLVEVRAELVARGATPEELRHAGDQRAHALLRQELASRAPGDAVLSEEQPGARGPATPERLGAERLWIVDPLDGTNEFGQADRDDWAVHVALVVDHQPTAAAVALPAHDRTLTTASPPAEPSPPPRPPRIVVSRSRRPAWVEQLAGHLGGEVIELGSAGAKAMSVVLGVNDVYVHDAGQYEWDSAAPTGVARAAGLHTSRLDGTPLSYNNADPRMPDLLMCRADLAAVVLAAVAELRRGPA